MIIGICVRISRSLDRNGNTVLTAVHKRDRKAAYRLRLQTKDEETILSAWVEKFSSQFLFRFTVAARGIDHEGCYYVLAPDYD